MENGDVAINIHWKRISQLCYQIEDKDHINIHDHISN